MKTTIDLPDEVIQRAKITAIQRKTTLKELIHRSLLRELGEQAQLYPTPPPQTLAEDEFPYVIDATTGMAVSRSLNTPGYVPPTADESQLMIERANEEEDLRRAGLLR